MRELKLLLFFIVFTSLSFAQDCKCKHWKKTSYNNIGQVRYEYEHRCYQPGSDWEYLGYDESYCNKLIEDEKRRIEDIKNTKEAIQISKNTTKQQNKDGYAVTDWWGKVLGNTGKWDLVGSPRFGVKQDSSFIYWNSKGKVLVTGKIKNQKFHGIFRLEDDLDLSLKSVLEKFSEYFTISNSFREPDYVYYDENNFSTFKVAQLNDPSHYKGYYIDKYGIPFTYYLFNNDKTTIFALPIDEENAIKIQNKIDSIETYKEYNIVVNKLTTLKNKLSVKKSSIFDFNEIQKNQLNELETNLIGTWSFLSNYNLGKDHYGSLNTYYVLSEKFIFNKDRTYQYNGQLISRRLHNGSFENPLTNIDTDNNGFWEMKDNKLFLYTIDRAAINFENFKEKYYNKVNDMLLTFNSIDPKNINKSQQWAELQVVRDKVLRNNIDEIFSYFVDTKDYYTNNLEKIKTFIREEKPEIIVSKENELHEIKFEILKSNKAIIKDLSFSNTLLFKRIELSENQKKYEKESLRQILGTYSDLTFILKGKKQKQ